MKESPRLNKREYFGNPRIQAVDDRYLLEKDVTNIYEYAFGQQFGMGEQIPFNSSSDLGEVLRHLNIIDTQTHRRYIKKLLVRADDYNEPPEKYRANHRKSIFQRIFRFFIGR